jgi:tyrosyl-tRNA synthetase
MAAVNPHFYDELEARGLIKQVTDTSLREILSRGRLTVYAGFDPTADSLHLGNLLPIMMLVRFQRAGHRVIAVGGGATGMIGDPSGKSAERTQLGSDHLERNLRGITRVLSRFIDLKQEDSGKVVNNAEWFAGFSYLGFLRDVGKHFTVNHMMAKESVRARLGDREHGISYTEFSYMLLQAYDFYHLFKTEGCSLQVGGSDQWGNITAGTELIRRISAAHDAEVPEVYGLTHPLITKADGSKFGKSVSGAVWLDADKTSPFKFYQFLLQTADADVITLLKFFTFLNLKEIDALEAELAAKPEARAAQIKLAQELTLFVHGAAAVTRAESATRALFGSEIQSLDAETLEEVFSDAPATHRSKASLASGVSLIDLLAETGLSGSKGAARKDVQGGGVYINNERLTDATQMLGAQHLLAEKFIVLRKGKKTYHLVRFEEQS